MALIVWLCCLREKAGRRRSGGLFWDRPSNSSRFCWPCSSWDGGRWKDRGTLQVSIVCLWSNISRRRNEISTLQVPFRVYSPIALTGAAFLCECLITIAGVWVSFRGADGEKNPNYIWQWLVAPRMKYSTAHLSANEFHVVIFSRAIMLTL